jgi:hypothetical protein
MAPKLRSAFDFQNIEKALKKFLKETGFFLQNRNYPWIMLNGKAMVSFFGVFH